MHLRHLGILVTLVLAPGSVRAQTTSLPPAELHDRVVALLRSEVSRPFPIGDTLVSWYKHPILFHLVHREADEVLEGMLRGDGMIGTAQVSLRAGRPASATILWTTKDSTLADVRISVRSDSLVITGTTSAVWPLPAGAWAIADYGMEDLVVPALLTLQSPPAPQQVAVYRPFGAHWDTLTVTSRTAVSDAAFFGLVGSDGKHDWWLVGPEGALLQIRREGQDFERRPLELTPLMKEYDRLVVLLPH